MDPVHDALADSDLHVSSTNAGLAEFVADNYEDVDDAERTKQAVIRDVDGNRLGDRTVEVATYWYNDDKFGVVRDTASDTGGWAFPAGRYDGVVDAIGSLDGFVIVEETE